MPVDPLAEIVTMLQPAARFSKLVECTGVWRMRRAGDGEPFYCAIIEGTCRITIDGQPPVIAQAGDFLLVPAMHDIINESPGATESDPLARPVEMGPGHFRIGPPDIAVSVRMRIGHCSFAAPDAALLVSLLPQMVIVRAEPRLATLMQLLGDETRSERPARDLVLERLLEVLLIEALRSGTAHAAVPSLAQGLADPRIAAALRALHLRPGHDWTIATLATEANLSRSAFFARFSRLLGLAPMEYLLAWRMALARRLLRNGSLSMDAVADSVGYGSASSFSTAFARHTGQPPARYARQELA